MKEQQIFVIDYDVETVANNGTGKVLSLPELVKEDVTSKGWHIDQITTEITHSKDWDGERYVLTILASKDIEVPEGNDNGSDEILNSCISNLRNNCWGELNAGEVESVLRTLLSMNRNDLVYVKCIVREVLYNVYKKNEEKNFDSIMMNTLNSLTENMERICTGNNEIGGYHYEFSCGKSDEHTLLEHITALKKRFNISYEYIFDDVNLFEE